MRLQIRARSLVTVLFLGSVIGSLPARGQIGQNETALLGGIVSSVVAGGDVDNAGTQFGLMGGLQLIHPFSTQIGLQAEVDIVQKGASLNLGVGSTGKSALHLSYFEVPVLLRVGFGGRFANVRPGIYFGPAISINVGCTLKVATQGGGDVSSDCNPDGPEIKALDYSVMAGADIKVGNFGAFARYDHGLTTIDASDARDDVKNRAIIFGLIWITSSR